MLYTNVVGWMCVCVHILLHNISKTTEKSLDIEVKDLHMKKTHKKSPK